MTFNVPYEDGGSPILNYIYEISTTYVIASGEIQPLQEGRLLASSEA